MQCVAPIRRPPTLADHMAVSYQHKTMHFEFRVRERLQEFQDSCGRKALFLRSTARQELLRGSGAQKADWETWHSAQRCGREPKVPDKRSSIHLSLLPSLA